MKMKINILEKSKNRFSIALCFTLVLLISSCEIGLGKAVDTLPPEVSITGPSTNSILRDRFILSGECSDDTGIKEVKIELKNTESGKTYGPINATPKKNKWEVSLNEPDESGVYPINDGKYDVTVQAYDFVDKDSGPRNISIVIDNTPPLMVLTRPAASDKYGQKFDITGQVADDSNIDLMEVSVYSKETDELLKTIQLKNVPPTIDLSAAVFGDEAYSAIYGTNKMDGDKAFYCEIKAYDAARKYPPEENDKGNETGFFYMYDDIYDLLENYKLTELHHIQNGLYSRNAATDSALEKLSIPAGEDGSIQTKRNDFILNPLNNPTFALSGYQPLTTYEELAASSSYHIKNEDKNVIINVNVGRDSTPLLDETLEVYAVKVSGKEGTEWIPAEDDPEKPCRIKLYPSYGNENNTEKKGSDRVIHIDMSLDYKLVVGGTYVFDVKGKDKSGNEIYNNGTDYGFYFKSIDKAPQLSLSEPNTGTVYVNKSGVIKVKGTVFHDEGKPSVNVELSQFNSDDKVVIPVDSLIKEGALYKFDYEISADDFVKTENKNTSGQYIISISATLGANTSSPIEKTLVYDVAEPEISVGSVSPVADTSAMAGGKEYNVNGKITIKVSINDDDSGIAYASYKCNGGAEIEIPRYTNFPIVIDTTELEDKQNLDLLFTAKDKAGNIKTYSLEFDDADDSTANPKYFVDQDTDKPLIYIEETQIRPVLTYTQGCDLTVLAKMQTITGKITDDDGLEDYTVSLYTVDSVTGALSEENVQGFGDTVTVNGALEKTISKQMPNENNIYKIVISAKDKKKVEGETQVSSEWYSFIKVAGEAPVVSVTSGNKSTVSTKGTKNILKIGGKFSGAHTPGENVAQHLKLFLLENTEEAKNDSTKWVQIFDAESVSYGSDALTKEWSCSVPVNDLPVKTEGETTVLIRVVDGNGRSTDDTLTYSIDDTKPDMPSVEEISDTITSSSYQFKTTSKDDETGSGLSGLFYQISTSEKSAASATDLTPAGGWTEVNGNGSFNFYQTFVGAESESVPAGQLKEGIYTLYMYAVDNAGNISDRAQKQITADFTLPVIGDTNYFGKPEDSKLLPNGSIFVRKPNDAELAADETLSDQYFILAGSVTDTLKISDIVLSAKSGETEHLIHLKDNTNALGEISALNPVVTKTEKNWIWSITLPFAIFGDGTWVFNYKAYDQSGRYSEQNTNLIIDTAAPELHYKWSSPISRIDWIKENSVIISEANTGTGISESSRDKVSYYQTTAEKTFEELKSLNDTQWTSFSGSSRTIPLEEGLNFIYIRSVDEAGNISYSNQTAGSATYICKVDRTKPILNITNPQSGKMIGAQEDTIIDVTIEEDGSGIKDEATFIKVFDSSKNQIGGNFPLVSISREGGSITCKATIPASIWNGRSDQEIWIEAFVEDNAGNQNDTSAKNHVLKFDRELPEIQINNPVASTVNGIIRVNGTSSDNGGMLRSVILYRTPVGGETGTEVVISTSSEVSEKTKNLVLLDENYSTFEGSDANVWEVSYDKESAKTNGFNTNNFADDTAFTIYAVATDQAGNVSYTHKAITVDQDSDRPVISLDNFSAVSGTEGSETYSTTVANAMWLKEGELRGKIQDDDGVPEIYISTEAVCPAENDTTAWGSNRYDNGSWKITLSDGAKNIWFKVVDKEGTKFVSAVKPSTAAALQTTPRIIDSNNKDLGKKQTGTYSADESTTTELFLKVDTTSPAISEVKYSTDGINFTANDSDLNNKAFGGPGSKAYISFKADDVNGITEAKVNLKGMKNNVETLVAVYDSTETNGVYTVEIPTSAEAKGTTEATKDEIIYSSYSNLKFEIHVEDNSGNDKTVSYSVRYDNAGPALAVSYTKDLYYGSVSNQLLGTSSDAANTPVADVFFKITEKKTSLADEEISATDWERITDITDSIHKYTSPMAWIINFTTSNQRTNGEYSASPLNDYLNAVFTPNAVEDENKASNMETVRDVTIWYYGVDQLGNKGTIGHTDLVVDPSGDRPIVTVDFPTNDNDSTGGSVRLNGAAQTPSPEVGVSTVWIQIDPSYSSAFASDWETELGTIISGREDILGYKVESAYYYDKSGDKKTSGITFKDSSGNPVDAKGILADMTSTTWSKYINKMDEFAASDGSVSTMAIRVYAISPTGKVSAPLTRIFKIDPDAPQITNLQLVQYADNVNKTGAKTVKSYADDMWVSGEWWLEADISDDDLGTVTYKNASGTETNLDISGRQTISSKQVYKFSQKVGSSTANSYGTLSYTINAQEAGGQKKSSQKVIRLNYDNKAPEFTLSTALDSDANVTNKIINSNGFFTPTGTASDSGAQSGIDKIVTYYKRSDSSAVDPLAAKSGTAFANTYPVTSETGTGIPFVNGIAAESVSGNAYQIKVTGTVPAFVRKGGLVRISNVHYVINTVVGNGIYTLDKAVPAGFESVDFAVAQVVEEGAVESAEADADADGLIEKLQNNAGAYSWFASFDSNNIEDGSITAGYVVFDNAGNYKPITKTTKVINNAPRIAGFRYGTDDNGDSSITGTELKDNLSGLTTALTALKAGTVLYRGNDFPVQGSKATPLFKIKGVTEIYPEVVGGNGNLTYGYTAAPEGADNFGTASRIVTGVSFATNSDLVTYDTIVGNTGISIALTDFLNGDTKGTIGDGVNKFTFTISDSTAGGAQSASFSFFADVVVQDNVSPVAKIRPFFWHKKGKPDSTVTKISEYYNSIYDGDLTQGHIELENDWANASGYDSSAATGLYDADPKVSGKIVLRGKASDNSLLEGLWFKIDSFTFTDVTADSTAGSATIGYSKLATYTPGTGWAFKKDENAFKGASNFYINVLNEIIDQDGHTVDWELGINTAAVTGVAATDIKVYVMATDRGKLALKSGSTTETEYVPNGTAPDSTTQPQDETADENWNESDKWSPYYRMDVVPYVTGVSTSLDKLNESNPSVYNRTALGHYPVYISTEYKGNSESSLTYEDTVETVKISGFNLSGAEYSSNSLAVTNGVVSLPVNLISASGKIALEVNNITTLNNINYDNAKGTSPEDTSNFVGYYNRQPNGVNNNLLTDDISFDIWEINTRAASPLSGTIKEPVMKINPGNGMLGFAFVNGAMSFSMPSGTPNSGGWYTNTSHDTMNGSGDFFTSVGFNYDKLGYSYGVAAGGDINIAGTVKASVCDPFAFMSSRWGKGNLATSTCKWGNGTFSKLENIGQVNGTEAVYMKPRFMSPSIATAVHGSKTDVYLAYYDDMNAEIRFRAGTINGTGSTYNDTGVTTRSDFGDFVDQYGGADVKQNEDLGMKAPQLYDITNCNLLAGNTTNYATGYTAGEYVSVGVVSAEGNSFDDVVVVVWYDSTNMQLYYTYNEIYNTSKNGINVTKAKYTYGTNGNGFTTPQVIHTGSAEYCKIAVDKQGGVHVAYCDKINGDVYYAYAQNYKSAFTTYLVDSYMMGGTELSLDVALDTNNKPIPYISYYGNSIARPKIAYLADASKLGNGAESDKFTQKWEVSVVPTTSIVVEDHFNVGAWKNDSGKLEAPTTTYASTTYKYLKTGTSKSGYVYDGSGTKTGYPSRYFDYKNNGVLVSSGNCGQVFGNGTSNPVVGYRNKVGTKGFIETAQMK